MKKKICLKNPKKVFPNEFTRITPRDFLNLRFNKAKHLTKKEKEKFEKMAGGEKESLIEYSDLLVARKGKCITIVDL